MKYILLFLFTLSCDKLNFSKYVILTSEGRWICEKDLGSKTYSSCFNQSTKEIATSIYSGNSVVLEIQKE